MEEKLDLNFVSFPKPLIKGSFGQMVYVKEHKMNLPKELADFLLSQNIRTAQDLLDYSKDFPAAIAVSFGWDLSDVYNARNELLENLKGFFIFDEHEHILDFNFGYGALPPKA